MGRELFPRFHPICRRRPSFRHRAQERPSPVPWPGSHPLRLADHGGAGYPFRHRAALISLPETARLHAVCTWYSLIYIRRGLLLSTIRRLGPIFAQLVQKGRDLNFMPAYSSIKALRTCPAAPCLLHPHFPIRSGVMRARAAEGGRPSPTKEGCADPVEAIGAQNRPAGR